ncbi:hypothetical protein SAMN05421823_11938 [Catalinimonas alkaloidigena]|uniref:Uncharacterized protein n=1 Tax=Catalinimonas alkaloidigena TaxID=1075417 RepID=A0A1G9V7C3_9BACT|nr:hypothetical protein [Catalinimonas alkaloidigena]SDM68000.1 hypothetical protein SAMN05421823_11938 [Catalinimonas alkaloidigena]
MFDAAMFLRMVPLETIASTLGDLLANLGGHLETLQKEHNITEGEVRLIVFRYTNKQGKLSTGYKYVHSLPLSPTEEKCTLLAELDANGQPIADKMAIHSGESLAKTLVNGLKAA